MAEIADILEEDETTIQNIYGTALRFAPEYDAERIVSVLTENQE